MRLFLSIIVAVFAVSAVRADVAVDMTFLKQIVPAPPVLSNLDPAPDDLGVAGARLGLEDNATTGSFMGHRYELNEVVVDDGEDVIVAAAKALGTSKFLILDAPADTISKIANMPEARDALLFNASSGARSLRSEACRANLFHTLPSDQMRTDALMQFFVKKRWSDLTLISGSHPSDKSYAAALETSAVKFGLKISERAEWVFDADMRRNAAQEVPLFTQKLGDYDALLIADEIHDFGRYVLYNTWRARPVAGSEGLQAVAWSAVVEQWGAAQLQNRFEKLAARDMRPKDYAAWAAVRSIGEAVTRLNIADPAALRAYLVSDEFELAGFKGRKMSFRAWNGQLRQPIPLVHPRALVTLAPLEGFLHQTTELDTLGIDEPESTCTAFKG
ncbi:MAG: ABC transporter substrate-binding protein [Pseudomonadota bacterium]